jgi:hypothetical protein
MSIGLLLTVAENACKETTMDKPYKLTISMTQETEGSLDSSVVLEEFSSDAAIHVLKTQVFAEELMKAINAATQRLTGAALNAMGQEPLA